jgi:hypothetical protein
MTFLAYFSRKLLLFKYLSLAEDLHREEYRRIALTASCSWKNLARFSLCALFVDPVFHMRFQNAERHGTAFENSVMKLSDVKFSAEASFRLRS